MNSTENQPSKPLPLSLTFLKSIIAGMGFVLIVGFTLIVAMILLGMKYFTDVRSCDRHPSGDIILDVPNDTHIHDIHVDCGIVKVISKDKLFGFDSETGDLKFTIHTSKPLLNP